MSEHKIGQESAGNIADQQALNHRAAGVEHRRTVGYLDQDPDAARIAFGLRLRQLRLGCGLSQDNLADRTEVHPTAIGRFERGAREPRLTTILRIARGLEVPPGALVDDLTWPESTDQKA
jgi:DNA-binding XRE family transcriptional regulator